MANRKYLSPFSQDLRSPSLAGGLLQRGGSESKRLKSSRCFVRNVFTGPMFLLKHFEMFLLTLFPDVELGVIINLF